MGVLTRPSRAYSRNPFCGELVETGPCSTLRNVQEVLDSLNVSVGVLCVVELVKVPASHLVKSDCCVIAEKANGEVVDCRKAAGWLRSTR